MNQPPLTLAEIDASRARFAPNDLELAYTEQPATWRLDEVRGEPTLPELHRALDAVWQNVDADTLRVDGKRARSLPMPLAYWREEDQAFAIAREAFLQVREAWLARELWPVTPQTYVDADCPGGRHPVRPRVPDGRLYRKRLPATGETFELVRARIDEHGEIFHRWQNKPRVAEAWNEDGTREEHDAYLRDRRRDPHIEPLVGYLDGEPFAYVEAYWAAEDRIGPHCEVRDYDQGLHLLVGEEEYLGGERTASWMRAFFHFLFLREPRTQRLVGEPAADNERVHERLRETGWVEHEEFSFDHKRALLVTLDRQRLLEEPL